ncbi:ras-associating and dilute domain-containing protein [Alosa sapidissima]|uniref:ras-associating and dilute domain-containing protein n=1 Tax=Alosa sapidissima TaxID=34773 RepID=UPI001C0A1A7D|nr:ras-associating and dilute domain-containing protein [Alosa sapidissima]
MFYGSSSASMSLPSKSRIKRQSKTFTQVLYRTLSYRDRRSVTEELVAPDDPAELSTATATAPGVLKVFGDALTLGVGTNYKSVLATPTSSAMEIVKEALERYGLGRHNAHGYVLCDVIGRLDGPERRWRTQCLRALSNNEKPLLLQDLWKPKEGHARRFELRLRTEVDELSSRDRDTVTADINAQARKVQRNRAKGTMTLSRSSLCRSLSETSLTMGGGAGEGEEPKRYYSTLPGPIRARSARDGTRDVMRGEQRKEGRDGGGTRHSLYQSPDGGGGARHSLYQSPHLLLLQGFNRQDCLVYLLNREQHTVGMETASVRPSICLSSPDILPLHCLLRRHGNQRLLVEPVAHGNVQVNFSRVERPTALRHGDLISFGAHYVFLYKEPLGAGPLPTHTLARLRLLGSGVTEEGGVCRMCGSAFRERPPSRKGVAKTHTTPTHTHTHTHTRPPRRPLQLEFEPAHEDALLQRITTLVEPSGDEHKLSPAFLLCLCIQHSANQLSPGSYAANQLSPGSYAANQFSPGSYATLMLKIARRIQTIAWEKTKELAQKQAQHQDPASLSLLSISDLSPDLQSIFFWMSNSIELLYFIQQKSPKYTQCIEQLETGSKESLLSASISVSEEAMSVLEEVIMYTFQQCVYYITKSLYVVLPGLLDCNPFGCERNVGGEGGVVPEPVGGVLQVFQVTQELLAVFLVHPDIQKQMYAYLFFFCNVSLFNQLMEKGPSRGWFQRSRVLQIQACVQLVLDWAKGAGLQSLTNKFFRKISSVLAILATPPQHLTQMNWRTLSQEYSCLKPVQLHRILLHYQQNTDITTVLHWTPTNEDETYVCRTVDLLESFENHPPIVLPTAGFHIDLEGESVEEPLYRQLLYIKHFLWGLRQREVPPVSSSPRPSEQVTQVTQPRGEGEGEGEGRGGEGEERGRGGEGEERGRDKVQRNGLVMRQGSQLTSDPSCLLTPPHTPLYPDAGPTTHTAVFSSTHTYTPPQHASLHDDAQTNGLAEGSEKGHVCITASRANGIITNGVEGSLGGFPFPVPGCRGNSVCSVFVVELEKGPYGLGMGLIDGLHTELKAPGIYVRTLIPDGPAASDGRLRIGDRILAVNGASLIGADYQSAVDLIRLGGGRLRLLIAKSDVEISAKISASSC